MFTINRGLSTGIYTTSNPEECHYILKDCKANIVVVIVVVENQKQLDKVLEVAIIRIVGASYFYMCNNRFVTSFLT